MNHQSGIIFLSVAFSGCCWAGLGLGLYATVSNNWIEYTNSSTSGLWYECSNSSCKLISETDYLSTTRAFMISMNTLNVIGGISMLVFQIKMMYKKIKLAGCVMGIAGLFGIIGAAVYTGFTEANTNEEFNYGDGFFDAWISIGLLIIASLISLTLDYKMKASERCDNRYKNEVAKL